MSLLSHRLAAYLTAPGSLPALQFLLIASVCCCSAGLAHSAVPGPAKEAPTSPAPAADPLGAAGPAQVQEMLQWLATHAPDPALVSQDSLNLAALRQLLHDPRMGARIISPASTDALPAINSSPLLAVPVPGAAYIRPGSFITQHLATTSAFLAALPGEIELLLLDLRGAFPPAPLAVAAQYGSLFLQPGQPLFQIQPRPSSVPASDSKPHPALVKTAGAAIWTKTLWILTDETTSPPAELLAHLLVRHRGAHCFGTATSGSAGETVDRPLTDGYVVRLPAASVLWPDGTRLSGLGLQPDFVVTPDPVARQALLALTRPEELTAHLMERDQPRFNEASLMEGIPPEILAGVTPVSRPAPAQRPDPVLQQAVDLWISRRTLGLDAPEEIKRAIPAPGGETGKSPTPVTTAPGGAK